MNSSKILKSKKTEVGYRNNSNRKASEREREPQTRYQVPGRFSGTANESPGNLPYSYENARFLQRTIGNRAVGKIVQTKLKIGSPGDKYEREADRVAEQVMRMPDRKEEIETEQTKVIPAAENRVIQPMKISKKPGISPTIQRFTNPLANMTTLQAAGNSGWRGAKYGCWRRDCKKRRCQPNRCNRMHRGLDIHATVGTEIRAVEKGYIRHYDYNYYGKSILLETRAGKRSKYYFYAHLSKRKPDRKRGRWLQYAEGTKIGETGVSGQGVHVQRPHLHFEYRKRGRKMRNAVDPEKNLPALRKPTKWRLYGPAKIINKNDPEPCKPC